MTITSSYVGEPECNGIIERFMPLSPSLPESRGSASDHWRVHRALQHRVAHRAARLSDARGGARCGDRGLSDETRSHSGVRIDDRQWGAMLISRHGPHLPRMKAADSEHR